FSVACPFGVALCLFGLSACQTTKEEEAFDPEAQGVAARVRYYQDEVAKSPEDAELHYRLGNALLDMGRNQDAYLAYQKAVQHKPDHANAYANLGLTMRKLGNLKAAVGAYARALDINPADKDTLNNLAFVAELTEDWERARWCYGELYALEPENMEYIGAYAAVLYGLGEYKKAIPVYEQLIAGGLEAAANTYRLGYCHYSLGQDGAAIETWESARNLAPENAPINRGLVAAYVATGNAQAAQAAAERCKTLGIALEAELLRQLDALAR
ncbi:MAG: tetratricopeptide repeat protein, partial [Candidatus Hydrogenedentes bacterium]|nr:tetratricopeptide repeat protein [Candidatus Hydrogenedentota bacterium]